MRVTSLQVSNLRSIASMAPIDLSSITLLVGPNNAGKSSLLRALYSIQDGGGDLGQDLRLGASDARIDLDVEEVSRVVPWGAQAGNVGAGHLTVDYQAGRTSIELTSST